jgi:plastocyanin
MNAARALRLAVVLGVAGALAASLAAAADTRVIQKDKTFSTRDLSIRVGEQVLFVNEDSVTHNVYSLTKGNEFEIRTQAPGQTDAVRFSREGVIEVQCAIHPKMKLHVTVSR